MKKLDTCLGCTPSAFLFTRVDLDGKAGVAFLVFAIVYLFGRLFVFAWLLAPVPQLGVLLSALTVRNKGNAGSSLNSEIWSWTSMCSCFDPAPWLENELAGNEVPEEYKRPPAILKHSTSH